jgi:hypothetical protein
MTEKKKVFCVLCRVRGEGKKKAVGTYYLPPEECQDPEFPAGDVPACEDCLMGAKRGGFKITLTDPALRRLHAGPHAHSWDKMSIYPGPKGQEWKCRKCGARWFNTFPGPDLGCSIPDGAL